MAQVPGVAVIPDERERLIRRRRAIGDGVLLTRMNPPRVEPNAISGLKRHIVGAEPEIGGTRIRKAIGWVLRETSKKRPTLVYEWLAPRASRA